MIVGDINYWYEDQRVGGVVVPHRVLSQTTLSSCHGNLLVIGSSHP